MPTDIKKYHDALGEIDKKICDTLYTLISDGLSESENKVWHGHPVWFLDGNPIVGYSKQKPGIKLMFWSGASFDEKWLQKWTGRFKDAGLFYTAPEQISEEDIIRWLEKWRNIQWDYKNIVKKRWVLERLK